MLDWERILVNDQAGSFFVEIIFRSMVMFFVLLVVLKFAGKRGIKQLSIFELVVIISLGSAAGDPMFYEDVGVVHGIVVLIIVILLYRGLTFISGKSPWIEKLIEGKPECLLSDGRLTERQYAKDSLGRDEFFSTLRVRNVEHLGQVKKAYLETSGDISVFFFDEQEVKPGLPILPEMLAQTLQVIDKRAKYSCCHCGATGDFDSGTHTCETCGKTTWIRASSSKRVA